MNEIDFSLSQGKATEPDPFPRLGPLFRSFLVCYYQLVIVRSKLLNLLVSQFHVNSVSCLNLWLRPFPFDSLYVFFSLNSVKAKDQGTYDSIKMNESEDSTIQSP